MTVQTPFLTWKHHLRGKKTFASSLSIHLYSISSLCRKRPAFVLIETAAFCRCVQNDESSGSCVADKEIFWDETYLISNPPRLAWLRCHGEQTPHVLHSKTNSKWRRSVLFRGQQNLKVTLYSVPSATHNKDIFLRRRWLCNILKSRSNFVGLANHENGMLVSVRTGVDLRQRNE